MFVRPSTAQLRALLRALFHTGDDLVVFAMQQPALRDFLVNEIAEASNDLDEFTGVLAEAAVRARRQGAVLDALALRFPGQRARIDAVRGVRGWAHLAVGPVLPIVAARGLAVLLFAAAVALPWLATWQGVLERPALARKELTPVAVQYRPELVLVPGGRFWMGSTTEERAKFGEGLPEDVRKSMEDEVRHEVEVGALYVARTEVTLAQWEAVMGTRPNDCQYGCADEHPVSNVTWNDACAYANRLTELENEVLQRRGEPALSRCYEAAGDTWEWPESNHACTGYRLPIETEWEYFARADTTTAYSFGDDLKDMCMYGNGADEAAKAKHADWDEPEKYGPMFSCDDGYPDLAPVGKFRPNPWGLLDVHGNVWEWVGDWYGDYPTTVDDKNVGDDDKIVDPGDKSQRGSVTAGYKGSQNGVHRVLRGGSFGRWPWGLRAAVRGGSRPADRFPLYGIRVVRVPPSP